MKILVDVGLTILSAVGWLFCGYAFGRMQLHSIIKKIMLGTDKIFLELGVRIDPLNKNTEYKTLSPIQTMEGVKLMNDKLAIIKGRMQVIDEIFDEIGLNKSKKVVKNSVQNPKG
jgi:hypothetical protein